MKRKAVTLQLEGEIPQSQSAYDIAVEEGYEGSEEQYGKELATIPPTQEQFDAIPGRISKLTSTTEKSDFHHITDSANMKVVDFGMEGKTEQETVSGNQLLNTYNITTKETNGITITQDNGRLILNGTSTDVIDLYVIGYGRNEDIAEALNGKLGTYRLSNNLGLENYFQRTNKTTSAQSTIQDTITITEELQLTRAFVRIPSGKTYNNAILEIMLNSGDTALPFELYVGGTPSPNPDYPQEIVNAGVYNEATGRYKIGCRVSGKNWFDKEWVKDLSTYDVQASSNSKYHRKYLYLEPNTKYRIVRNQLPTNDINQVTVLFGEAYTYDNEGGSGLITLGYSGKTDFETRTAVLTTDDTGKCVIKTQCYQEADINKLLDRIEIMIYKLEGAVDDTYVPYEGQPFTLTSPVPLTKWDKLVKRDGVWGWRTFDKEYEVTGLEMFIGAGDSYYLGASTNMYHMLNDITSLAGLGMENRYIYCNELSFMPGIWSRTDGSVGMNTNGKQLHIRLPNRLLGVSDDATVDEKKTAYRTYLEQRYNDGNPLKLLYKTDEEQSFRPLPEEEQELLNNLETYYGVTNLYNDQGCPMWLTYVQDTKTAVDNKFNNIRQAVLSLGGNV